MLFQRNKRKYKKGPGKKSMSLRDVTDVTLLQGEAWCRPNKSNLDGSETDVTLSSSDSDSNRSLDSDHSIPRTSLDPSRHKLWYYSSNHVLVNKERTYRGIHPVIRSKELDEIACEHAEIMAEAERVHQSDPQELESKFQEPCNRLGVNVASGTSIRDIHKAMMNRSVSYKRNIVDKKFTFMGMGTARGPSGELYLCQIFKS